MRVRSRIDGRQLTANIREVVTEDKSQVRAMRKRMTAQAKQMGISKQTVDMRKFLHEVTMNMRKVISRIIFLNIKTWYFNFFISLR